MDLKIKNVKMLAIYNALENAGKIEVEFADEGTIHDLCLNKKSMECHVEAVRLIDRESPDYKKFLRAVSTAKQQIKDHSSLKAELINLETQYAKAIENEYDRRDKMMELLDKEVIIKNIVKIKRKTAAGELTVKGKGGKELQFIQALEPLFDDKNAVEVPAVSEQKTKKK